tara:strand:+ start:253 stop:474 length:222 start_codon:yes stop_codon:yes gene_type:complete
MGKCPIKTKMASCPYFGKPSVTKIDNENFDDIHDKLDTLSDKIDELSERLETFETEETDKPEETETEMNEKTP